ncbi:alpha/beta hydrolase [Arcticibacter tournemirensis]
MNSTEANWRKVYLIYIDMYTHKKQYITTGAAGADARAALIMLHGRGAAAEDIVRLSSVLHIDSLKIYAPQATNSSWYPYSFMADDEQNQPALASALEVLNDLVNDVNKDGISTDRIYFLGFSQGACLALEYIARYPASYAGVIAFTGGLIGKTLDPGKYAGNLIKTPVLITTGVPDEHVPFSRVEETVKILGDMHAEVTLKVFKGRRHTIINDEITLANDLILKNALRK